MVTILVFLNSTGSLPDSSMQLKKSVSHYIETRPQYYRNSGYTPLRPVAFPGFSSLKATEISSVEKSLEYSLHKLSLSSLSWILKFFVWSLLIIEGVFVNSTILIATWFRLIWQSYIDVCYGAGFSL